MCRNDEESRKESKESKRKSMAERAQPMADVAPATTRASRAETVRLALLLASGLLMLVNLALIFFWVPLEQSMGILFLIFYFHVPLALAGFIAAVIVFISSILYLWKGQRKWDALAHSAAEIGVLFITLTIITGAIWAKKFNGVWWTWDPRLTTTLILWLMYVGYLMVRAYAPTPSQAARYSAVMGVISFIDVPIVYLSAVWWRNIIHPNLYLGPLAEEGSLEPRMEAAVIFSLLTFTFLLAYLVWERLAQRNSEDTLQEVRYTRGAY